MREVVDYVILGNASRSILRKEVVENLKKGWELHGTPYVTSSDYHFQAMVLYGPETDKIGEDL